MRPDRENIAAPDLPETITWVGGCPGTMPELTARGPVLVHFFDFAQLNSVRTLPYLAEWWRRYGGLGLGVVGVQAPRFPFGADEAVVATALARLEVDFPVAIDAERELWLSYGCEGWPSLFLWGLGGALRWFHFGEGEYEGTELAIQEELRKMDALRELPVPMAPLRATDAAGARVMAPSAELFPGGSWDRAWVGGEDGDELVVDYEGGGSFAAVEGHGTIGLALDEEPAGSVDVDGPGLYRLAEHPRHERHTVALRPAPGQRVWSLSFAAGLP